MLPSLFLCSLVFVCVAEMVASVPMDSGEGWRVPSACVSQNEQFLGKGGQKCIGDTDVKALEHTKEFCSAHQKRLECIFGLFQEKCGDADARLMVRHSSDAVQIPSELMVNEECKLLFGYIESGGGHSPNGVAHLMLSKFTFALMFFVVSVMYS